MKFKSVAEHEFQCTFRYGRSFSLSAGVGTRHTPNTVSRVTLNEMHRGIVETNFNYLIGTS